MSAQPKMDVFEVGQMLADVGYDRADIIEGNTYRDLSTVIVCPTRGGKPLDYESKDKSHVGTIPVNVVQSWIGLVRPTNHRSSFMFVRGDEIAVAYNRAIQGILNSPQLRTSQYILTVEDDNILPPHALVAMLQSIQYGPYDVMAGVYHMKGAFAIPMAFGRPGQKDEAGGIDLSPVRLTNAILADSSDVASKIVEVNGVACGCTLWRLDLFRELEPPWFKTFTRFDAHGNVEVMTQDMYWCRRLVEAGKRIAVDTRVMVGHLDVSTGSIY